MEKTKWIAHRVNSIAELKQLPTHYGVELDIRPYANELIIAHDPFVKGELFEEYLSHYQHGTLILNVKAERIELSILDLLKKYNIKDYFFLDSSFPMIYLLSQMGEKHVALRFSEFEGLDTIRAMAGKVEWVWVDCFTQLPINKVIYDELKALGYKLCLVSPELQKQDEKIEQYRDMLRKENLVFDAICTKSWNIMRWQGQSC